MASLMLALSACVLSACSADAPVDEEPAASSSSSSSSRNGQRLYTAEWVVDAAAIGREPAYAYRYSEMVDDRAGTYLTTGPQHLALQTPPQVTFCAGIWQAEPRCASTDRPENTPNVMALGLSVIRQWHPEELYEVADFRRMDLIAESEPDRWSRTNEVSVDIAVECFRSQSPDEKTPDGLSLCYTADEYRLLASVDMNGDSVFEVYLDRYERSVDEDELELSFEVLDDPKRYEQLLVIFPDVPITPTPVPVDENGTPIPESEITEP